MDFIAGNLIYDEEVRDTDLDDCLSFSSETDSDDVEEVQSSEIEDELRD